MVTLPLSYSHTDFGMKPFERKSVFERATVNG
jgi:hypothetical protein